MSTRLAEGGIQLDEFGNIRDPEVVVAKLMRTLIQAKEDPAPGGVR